MSQQGTSNARSPSILERFKEMETFYDYAWDDDANSVPRRIGQKFRYIDESFEDSSVVCHEPEPHPHLCFCVECLS